jgi:hypothetical protein
LWAKYGDFGEVEFRPGLMVTLAQNAKGRSEIVAAKRSVDSRGTAKLPELVLQKAASYFSQAVTSANSSSPFASSSPVSKTRMNVFGA